MKHNTLIGYREFLKGSMSGTTALTYYKAMDFLLNDQSILDCKKMDIEKVMIKLRTIKYKNQYSKYKNAFLKFCDFINLELPKEIKTEIETMNKTKKKKRRKLKKVELKDITNHVKVIRDKKLKLSFETMLSTGLRVSELSQIKKEHCKITDEFIELSFIGKGGEHETVSIIKADSKKIFNSLAELLHQTENGKKVFYSISYLQGKAKEKGFSCHDLRRAYAKTEYKKDKDINKVMDKLRHKKRKNTKIYLSSKVKI